MDENVDAGASGAEPASLYTHKVLLVEDYAANVLVATSFLEHFGLQYEVATNGTKAVELVKTGAFDVVLMDVQMHGMNGFEATQAIRQHEADTKLPRLPIIGMTAHALAGDRERCVSAGMDDYIAKPFNPDELRQKIFHYLKIDAAA